MLAQMGREGCEWLLKCEENEKDEVVGRVNGKGMLKGSERGISTVYGGVLKRSGSAIPALQ